MSRITEKEKIAIEVLLDKENEKRALDIVYGIEEEGIPYQINYTVYDKNINDDTLIKYAFEQARKSKLSLGIVVANNKAVFHFSKLKEQNPLFILDNLENTKREQKRTYGSNIARIVKGIPLKDINEIDEKIVEREDFIEKIEKENTQEMSDKMSKNDLKDELHEEVLKKVMEYILKENNVEVSCNKEYFDTNLELAEKLVAKAFEKATKEGLSMSVSVVNKGGNLILLKKQDEAIVASIDVSYKKAYTALSLNCPSSKVDLNEFPGLDQLMKDKIVLFGGGYPIVYKGKLIGGLGVSGGSSEQDERIAKETIEEVLV